MRSDLAISVKSISKSYPARAKPHERLIGTLFRNYQKEGFVALRAITFDVFKGETIGVLGRNGSGKSTLLQILAGTLKPSSGSYCIHGKLTALLELGAGFNPEFTGRENIILSAAIYGVSKKKVNEKIEEIISFADIGSFMDQPVKTYSSGMYARLAFSVSISFDPEILIVDEILSVGDVFFQAKCMKKLDEFRSQGGTVFFVTHDTYSVERICTRVIVLNKSEMIYEGDTKNGINLYYKTFKEAEADSGELVKLSNAVVKNKHDIPQAGELVDADAIGIRRDHVVKTAGAYIEAVCLYDDNGAPTSSFSVGEWMHVSLKLSFSESFDEVDFGFGIRDKTGILLGGYHTLYDGDSLLNVKSGDEKVVHFKIKLDIAPRDYLLIAGVARHMGLHTYEECYGLYDFAAIHVTGKKEFWGEFGLLNNRRK